MSQVKHVKERRNAIMPCSAFSVKHRQRAAIALLAAAPGVLKDAFSLCVTLCTLIKKNHSGFCPENPLDEQLFHHSKRNIAIRKAVAVGNHLESSRSETVMGKEKIKA